MKLKICGIRNIEMLHACKEGGVVYGGINFIPTSRRCAAETFLSQLPRTVKDMKYVGIFQNQSLEFINEVVRKYKLSAVQLHGTELLSFIQKLNIPVIKAISLKKEKDIELITPYLNQVKILLLDSPAPGKGQLIEEGLLQRVVHLCQENNQPYAIAGGINPDTVDALLERYPDAEFVDVASGVENESGDFSKIKLSTLLTKLS